jgi:hypothetical protein
MSQHEQEHESHGQSVAAWTAVAILLVASLVMSLAVVFPSKMWFAVGVVIAVLGVAAGKVLAMAGYGAAKAGTQEGARGERGPHVTLPGGNQADSGTS